MREDLARILQNPIAHRGLHDQSRGVIENSMAAARAAISAGFGIECDIQLSLDGEAMVFHDDTLDRLTAAIGPVGGRTAPELTEIALEHGGGDTIPSLKAFLDLIAGQVPIVIEIKSKTKEDMRLVARAVELAQRYHGPLALKSFDPAVMAQCRALGATCPLGLVGPAPQSVDTPPSIYDFLSWNIGSLAAIRQVHRNIPMMTWTIRSPDQQADAVQHHAQIVFETFRPAGFMS